MEPHSRASRRFIAAFPKAQAGRAKRHPGAKSRCWAPCLHTPPGDLSCGLSDALARAPAFSHPLGCQPKPAASSPHVPGRRTREWGSGPCAVRHLMKRTAKRSKRHAPAYPMHAPLFPPCVQRAHQALSLSCWERTISRYSPQVAISSSWVPSPATPPSDNTRMRSQ